jgi:hypothetical protein
VIIPRCFPMSFDFYEVNQGLAAALNGKGSHRANRKETLG